MHITISKQLPVAGNRYFQKQQICMLTFKEDTYKAHHYTFWRRSLQNSEVLLSPTLNTVQPALYQSYTILDYKLSYNRQLWPHTCIDKEYFVLHITKITKKHNTHSSYSTQLYMRTSQQQWSILLQVVSPIRYMIFHPSLYSQL